jgi:hypothetical protein
MCNAEKDFALLYFENKSVLPVLNNFKPNTSYSFQWFDTIKGEWKDKVIINSDEKGKLLVPEFPEGQNPLSKDWASKIVLSI